MLLARLAPEAWNVVGDHLVHLGCVAPMGHCGGLGFSVRHGFSVHVARSVAVAPMGLGISVHVARSVAVAPMGLGFSVHVARSVMVAPMGHCGGLGFSVRHGFSVHVARSVAVAPLGLGISVHAARSVVVASMGHGRFSARDGGVGGLLGPQRVVRSESLPTFYRSCETQSWSRHLGF
jgi:hypothetical protein